MANMVEKAKRGRLERIESLLKSIRAMAATALSNDATAKNRVQQQALSGAVVAAGGAITLDGALTTVGPTGKIRISANWSGVAAGVAAGVHSFLQVKIGAGAFVTVYDWAPLATASHFDQSAVFEFDSAAAPGTVLTVHWQTTAGDDAVTIGGTAGAGINGATLLLEELP